MKLRSDGRYLEWDLSVLREGRWETFARDKEPCDPWGWARFVAPYLALESQSATCEQLADPISVPSSRHQLVIREADAHGFGGEAAEQAHRDKYLKVNTVARRTPRANNI
jgi:hypothetical protein